MLKQLFPHMLKLVVCNELLANIPPRQLHSSPHREVGHAAYEQRADLLNYHIKPGFP